jgi:hypothetical protein
MEMRNYQEMIETKKAKFSNFSDENLNPNFTKYYENGKRIEVDFGYETKRGTIGITTGGKPCFLLMLRRDSVGSSYTIGKGDKVVREIK